MVWPVGVSALRTLGGGAVISVAVGATHYVGTAALSMPAQLHWHFGYILASLAVGGIFATLALHVMARRNDLPHRIVAAVLLCVGVAGLHFTGMTGATLVPDPRIAVTPLAMSTDWLAVLLGGVMGVSAVFGLAGAAVDEHLARLAVRDAEQLRCNIAELETTRSRLAATTANLEMALDVANEGARAKAQFIAMMSHELRTPLNAIIGFSEIMSQEMAGPLSPRYQDFARDILASGNRLRQIVDGILDLSKSENARLHLDESGVDLVQLIDGAAAMIREAAATRNVAVVKEIRDRLPLMRGDCRLLLQILSNLLSNAIAFTPAGGSVTIHAERRIQGVAVIVSGSGMTAEDIAKALECFGQVDGTFSRKHSGAGLGLFISRRLVELHDGTLSISSQPGAGTSVTLMFPNKRIVENLRAA